MANTRNNSRRLSEQLRKAILNCGKSRYHIAQDTDITEATLSRFIHGHHGLSQETFDVLGEYLELKLVTTKRKGEK